MAADSPPESQLLTTLQELLALPALDLDDALTAATQRISETLSCDKVDVFLVDEHNQTLRAIGTSDTPMGRLQRALGLDRIAIANGGRTVETFKTGVSFLEAHADRDPGELRGIVGALGVRSTLSAPIDVDGVRRGVLAAASAQPEFFQNNDLRFLEAAANWTGMLTHRAELAELARKSEAERARRAGADEIITILAHDLRNHLHPLLGRLQLLRLQIASGRSVRSSDVEAAIQSVQRLTRLTNDLLDLKRLDQGLFNIALVPTDLVPLARETAAALATSTVPVRVTGAETLVVIADPDRLRQALENLVANAVRYSPAGKAVEINVAVEQDANSARALILVIDSGAGIAPELLATLFDRFRRGSDSPGLGLGLHLAHRIVAIHGGELSAESRLGLGTRFRLTLPLPPSNE